MKEARLTATYQEICEQPVAWAQAIAITDGACEELLAQAPLERFDRVLLTGCGSTYYLAQGIAALFNQWSFVPAFAAPGSELWLNPRNTYPPGSKYLLIAFSRSGTTSETIAAVKRFKGETGGAVIAVTTAPDSDLAQLADILLGIPLGQEESVAQTRSFASMYVAGVALALTLSGIASNYPGLEQLPDIGRRLIAASEAIVRPVAEDLQLDRFYFLGSGPRYGLACEANLKMKEMSLTHSEPFHFLEFRHGPMSMVGESTCVIGLLSESNYLYEAAVLQEMRAKGAAVLTLGETGTDIRFDSNLPESIRNCLYLPPLQLMALYRSLAKGLDPDRPVNLTAVIKLDIH